MVDLSKPWPLGLGEKLWWRSVLAALILLAVALPFDHQISVWAMGFPDPIRGALAEITPYGESDWILWPAAALFLVTAAVALFMKWRLMRTLLWQFTALYAFIFCGVGLPSLVSTLAKRVIGRGRPDRFADGGTLNFHWNWLDWTYQSFPSGHTTTAFALAAVIGFASPRWFYPGLALAAVIGASRMTAGAHYPTDVIGGALLGLVGAYAVRWAFARRGWLFDTDAAGRIEMRPMSSLKRYIAIKRRSSVAAPQPDHP
ncbi:MAG: phosphatase PAP2 family protein [Pseudoxanthomonas sp.]